MRFNQAETHTLAENASPLEHEDRIRGSLPRNSVVALEADLRIFFCAGEYDVNLQAMLNLRLQMTCVNREVGSENGFHT